MLLLVRVWHGGFLMFGLHFSWIILHNNYLKWTLRTQTVTHIDNVTRVMVKSKYLPNNGTANEVGGMISASNKKNTVNDTKIELHNVTCKIRTG